ncbi:MAG: hypothetical protein BWZ02_00644 [Lentisphaerae bacterium ADurb.BinA184]|nr:MAG: hypothetical protein BWZ02_00644 [Lentisphaerae bacterium ADurb.BinA184]
MGTLDYLEGRRLCVVVVKVLDERAGRVQMQALHGRASVEHGKLAVITPDGVRFGVPNTALGNILPNDGTALLKDAEYFVLVKADAGIALGRPDACEECGEADDDHRHA